MKNAHRALVINALFCLGLGLVVVDSRSMEMTPLQKHQEWLYKVKEETVSDVKTIVDSLCYLSRYINEYRGYNFLKNQEAALSQLKRTRNALLNISTHLEALSTDRNRPTALRFLTALPPIDEKESTVSRMVRLVNTLSSQSLPVGQKLTNAFQYLHDYCCRELEIALSCGKVPVAVAAMEQLSCNTQMLFLVLHNVETLNRYCATNGCKDQRFFNEVQTIGNFLKLQPVEKSEQEQCAQSKKEMVYAQWIKKTFAPIGEGLQASQEIAQKPDISGLALMFLKPSFVVRKALPLVEKYRWIRRCLGPQGKDIETAMAKDMAPTKIIKLLEEKVPPQLKPVIIPLLKNYGKTVINPLLYCFDKSLFLLRSVSAQTSLYAQDWQEHKLPSLEEQFYPCVADVGSTFNATVQEILAKGNHSNPNRFEAKWQSCDDDCLILKKKRKLEEKYASKNEKYRNACYRCKEKDYQLKKAQERGITQAIKVMQENCLQAQEEQKKKEDALRRVKNKLDIVCQILSLRGYDGANLKSKKNTLETTSVESQSLENLIMRQKLISKELSDIKDSFDELYEKYRSVNTKIQEKEEAIAKAEETSNLARFLFSTSEYVDWIKELKEELNDLNKEAFEFQKQITEAKKSYQVQLKMLEKYDAAIQSKGLKKDLIRSHLLSIEDYLGVFCDTCGVSTDLQGYFKSLALENSKEFKKVIKRFYENQNQSTNDLIQNLFNAWFLFILDREQAPFLRIRETNTVLLKDIRAKAKIYHQQFKDRKKKTINELWPSYDFKTKCGAWLFFLLSGRFPIFARKEHSVYRDQKRLYKEALSAYDMFMSTQVLKYVDDVEENELLSDQRNKQRVYYNLIRLIFENTITSVVKKDQQTPIEIKEVAVEQQTNAECGYHALYNALKAVNIIQGTTVHEFIEEMKFNIKHIRNSTSDDAQWLNEDELARLNKFCGTKDKVIFMPNVSRYSKGSDGLAVSIINEISQIHEDLDSGKDFERAYIVSLASEENSWNETSAYVRSDEFHRNFTHWIAIKQINKDGKTTYEIMDSLGNNRNSHKIAEELTIVMHEKRGFKKLEKGESEILKNLVKRIEFSKAFEHGSYAKKSRPNRSEGDLVVVNADPEKLVEDILSASSELLLRTNKEPFYNCMGFVDPVERVKKGLQALESRLGNPLTVHIYCDDQGETLPFTMDAEQQDIRAELLREVGHSY